MSSKSHHVVPDPDGGWNIRKGGSERISGHFNTQERAIKEAREISDHQNTELYIHGRDGQIREKDSHGNDPYPPRG
jgi:uncharacterized protein YdaT